MAAMRLLAGYMKMKTSDGLTHRVISNNLTP
jgi:hypothetical protein